MRSGKRDGGGADMSDANRYTELIAGAHFDQPRYQQFIYELTEPLNEARKRLAVFYKHFDVDTAVGVQLDAVGVRVGISRCLPMKLVGVYFALDDVDGVGFDKGVWKGQFDPSDGMVTLDDETYRAVIKTKILANKFDGKNESVPEFLNTALGYFGVPAKLFDFQGQQNMHVVINLTKAETPPIVWELISRRLIDIVAAGVGMQIVDNVPYFGFDYETASIQGFDSGHFFPFEN